MEALGSICEDVRAMGDKKMARNIGSNGSDNKALSVLVILAGAFATGSPLFSKFYYMALIALLGFFGLIRVNGNGYSVIKRFGRNKYLVYLDLYMLFIVACWQAVKLVVNGNIDHIAAGVGNVIYILGAALFFSLYSKKSIRLFCGAYVFAFCCLFLVTGKWTLYDLGDVSRTIGVYMNPNYLAFYAFGSVCFSLFLYSDAGKMGKVLCILSAGLAAAAIINSGSRAMYLGVLASLALISVIILFRFALERMVSNRKAATFIAFSILFAAVVLIIGGIFTPRMENAVLDTVHGIDKTNQSPWSLLAPAQVTGSAGTIAVQQAVSSSNGIERILNSAYTTGGAFSTNRRLDIWKLYLERFNEYVLFGSNPTDIGFYFPEFSRIYVTHNTFLNMLFKYGILGFLLYLSVLWNCFIPVSKVRHLSSRYICVLGLVSLCVFSCFHDIVDYPVFWCFLALTLRLTDSGQCQAGSSMTV